jgi:hypothetical protein
MSNVVATCVCPHCIKTVRFVSAAARCPNCKGRMCLAAFRQRLRQVTWLDRLYELQDRREDRRAAH